MLCARAQRRPAPHQGRRRGQHTRTVQQTPPRRARASARRWPPETRRRALQTATMSTRERSTSTASEGAADAAAATEEAPGRFQLKEAKEALAASREAEADLSEPMKELRARSSPSTACEH